MIDFAGLVGKITGKMPGQTDGSAAIGGTDAGIATGGEFAALLRHAAQVEAGAGEGRPHLVADNGAVPTAAMTIMPEGMGMESMPVAVDTPSTDADEDGKTDGAAPILAETPSPNPLILPINPGLTPVVATVTPRAATAGPAPEQASLTATAPATAVLMATRPAAQTFAAVQMPAQEPSKGAARAVTSPAATNPAATGPAVQMPAAALVPPANPGVGQNVQVPQIEQIAQTEQDAAEMTGIAVTLVAGDAPQQAKPGVLTAAWRMLAPRQRIAGTAEKIDTALPMQPVPAAGRSGETPSPVAMAARTVESGAPSPATDGSAAISSPLRAIVEGLPPVVQSELGTASVRTVAGPAGPSTGDALVDQVIDMGVSGQWIDRMAREIAGLADGSGHSRFTLTPPHLGRLQVDLWREEGATSIRMLTETDEAAQRLMDGRSALQADARVAALSLGAITVEKSNGSFDQAPRDQGGSQRQGSDPFGQQADGQAQSRAGNGQANGQGRGQGSDWVSRIAQDQPNHQDEASSRVPSPAVNGRVRFA